MEYSLDPYDGLSILEGILAAAEVHLAAGATRIVTAQAGVEDYYPAEGHAYLADPKWLEWVAKVRKAGVVASWTAMGSAHQMGRSVLSLLRVRFLRTDGCSPAVARWVRSRRRVR